MHYPVSSLFMLISRPTIMETSHLHFAKEHFGKLGCVGEYFKGPKPGEDRGNDPAVKFQAQYRLGLSNSTLGTTPSPIAYVKTCGPPK